MADGTEVQEAVAIEPAVEETVVEKTDRIIAEQSPQLIEKLREIRNDQAREYHGLTKAQISQRFRITMTGEEGYQELRTKLAQCVTVRQEAAEYQRDCDIQLKRANAYIDNVKIPLDREIVLINLTARRNDKVSDKSREALVSRVEDIGEIRIARAELSVENDVWKGVIKDIDTNLKAIEQSLTALSSENKYAGPVTNR